LGGLTAYFWALRIRPPFARFPACRFWRFFGGFLGRFAFSRAIYQGNKKSPFSGQFSRRFAFPLFRFRSWWIPSAWIG
jgi:hypothetical protein